MFEELEAHDAVVGCFVEGDGCMAGWWWEGVVRRDAGGVEYFVYALMGRGVGC